MLAILVTFLGLLSIISAGPAINQGSGGPSSPQYGPPQEKYGPPGHTPGKPLGLSKSGGYEQHQQSQSQSCPPNDPQFNLDLVKRAYQEVFGDHNLSNLDKYWAEDYIQHNPMVGDGLAAFKVAVMGPLGKGPTFKFDFKHVATDGDLVWTHTKLPLFGKMFATVDIFRIQCGKIQEHWDVLQDTDIAMSANPHPFF